MLNAEEDCVCLTQRKTVYAKLISDDNRTVSVMTGTPLYVYGSCERHSKLTEEMRTPTQSASSALEEERRHQAQSARERRHLAASIPATAADFPCPVCARLCKSRIGLHSHSRTHR